MQPTTKAIAPQTNGMATASMIPTIPLMTAASLSYLNTPAIIIIRNNGLNKNCQQIFEDFGFDGSEAMNSSGRRWRVGGAYRIGRIP